LKLNHQTIEVKPMQLLAPGGTIAARLSHARNAYARELVPVSILFKGRLKYVPSCGSSG
jgi:hypothetical protein